MTLIQKTSSRSCDEVVAALKEAAAGLAVAVVAHINGQANAAKRGMQVDCDQILEIFRPDWAVKVWAADKTAGIDIPLRVHVYAQGGKTVISYRSPSRVFAAYAHPDLTRLGAELDDIFAALCDRVPIGG